MDVQRVVFGSMVLDYGVNFVFICFSFPPFLNGVSYHHSFCPSGIIQLTCF